MQHDRYSIGDDTLTELIGCCIGVDDDDLDWQLYGSNDEMIGGVFSSIAKVVAAPVKAVGKAVTAPAKLVTKVLPKPVKPVGQLFQVPGKIITTTGSAIAKPSSAKANFKALAASLGKIAGSPVVKIAATGALISIGIPPHITAGTLAAAQKAMSKLDVEVIKNNPAAKEAVAKLLADAGLGKADAAMALKLLNGARVKRGAGKLSPLKKPTKMLALARQAVAKVAPKPAASKPVRAPTPYAAISNRGIPALQRTALDRTKPKTAVQAVKKLLRKNMRVSLALANSTHEGYFVARDGRVFGQRRYRARSSAKSLDGYVAANGAVYRGTFEAA